MKHLLKRVHKTVAIIILQIRVINKVWAKVFLKFNSKNSLIHVIH